MVLVKSNQIYERIVHVRQIRRALKVVVACGPAMDVGTHCRPQIGCHLGFSELDTLQILPVDHRQFCDCMGGKRVF